MDEKKIKLKKLLYSYVFIVGLTIVLVAPPHFFPQPYFIPLRFPHYLEMMPTFLGISWPMSFEIYHYVIYALVIMGSLNALGIILYPRLRRITLFSSFIGLFLISSMILFFFFQFINVNRSTALIFGFYSVILLIVDWLTFKTLIKRTKEVPEES